MDFNVKSFKVCEKPNSSKTFESAKLRKVELLCHFMELSEDEVNPRLEMHSRIIDSLYEKVTQVLDTFNQFSFLWKSADEFFTEKNAREEMEAQSKFLKKKLDMFEDKLIKSETVMMIFKGEVWTHFSLFRSRKAVAMTATNWQDLERITVPSLNWMASIPDPKSKELAVEWEVLKLQPKVLYLLRRLQQIRRAQLNK